MRIHKTAEFERSLNKLPQNIKRLFKVQEARLEENPTDRRLHIKKLHFPEPIYSFRVSQSYRALFYFDIEKNIILFAIDNRKDVYR